MLKRLSFLCLLFIGITTWLIAADYTVVLKNGKTMKGTLVSETADTIIFKDSAGIQYSLKKDKLDMDKMASLNTAAPAEQPSAQTEPAQTPKKTGKTYTAEDIEKLREKYGDSALAVDTGGAKDFAPDKYVTELKSAVGTLTSTTGSAAMIADAVYSANAKGGDNTQQVYNYLQSEGTQKKIHEVEDLFATLAAKRGELSSPPDGLQAAYEAFSSGLESAMTYFNSAKLGSVDQPSSDFIKELNETLAPAANAQVPAATSDDQENSDQDKSEDQDQKPPSNNQ